MATRMASMVVIVAADVIFRTAGEDDAEYTAEGVADAVLARTQSTSAATIKELPTEIQIIADGIRTCKVVKEERGLVHRLLTS